jgi:hypothetical protein
MQFYVQFDLVGYFLGDTGSHSLLWPVRQDLLLAVAAACRPAVATFLR